MHRSLLALLFAGLALALVTAPEARAQKKKLDITKTWNGSVEDEKAIKPEAITSTKGLEAAWKAWNQKDEMPKVDFSKDIVVAVYSVGSRLNIAGANLDEKGNLTVLGFGTRDIRPGFRFVLGTVSKEGIKTVNGKDLPKE